MDFSFTKKRILIPLLSSPFGNVFTLLWMLSSLTFYPTYYSVWHLRLARLITVVLWFTNMLVVILVVFIHLKLYLSRYYGCYYTFLKKMLLSLVEFNFSLVREGGGYLRVTFTGTHSFIRTLSNSLAQKLWALFVLIFFQTFNKKS